MAIRKIGSQMRERLEETDYRLVRAWPEAHNGDVVLEDQDGKRELWSQNDHHSGYTIEIDGRGYEFIRSLPYLPEKENR